MDKSTKKYTNALVGESSPYLLQHAHNPVDWHAWNQATFEKAKQENKLILISIGYSACHWCHVMERECFEDSEVAELMNKYFINIKVDREERPDIDQVYMTAVQIMTGRGGWPLNCFALPDGRPIYGGTYFPKESWMNVLGSLAELWKNDKAKAEDYAAKLTEGVQQSEKVLKIENSEALKWETLHTSVQNWKNKFDHLEGGPNRHPKFPLPNNYSFLLQYALAQETDQSSLLSHIKLTLDKMCRGGIYDQIGGGFARYSTDALWKVPHFEKMLYDNAQLISLYAEAYAAFQETEYLETMEETIRFCERELMHPSGAFYSALDADSEGVEGKFYVWTKEELQKLLGNDYPLFAELYNVNSFGEWEGNYIPLRKKGISAELKSKVQLWKETLLHAREKRIRPGLDDKCLASWNGLMLKACCDAYRVTGKEEHLLLALRSGRFLKKEMISDKGQLFHNWKNGKASINAFLEDLSFVAEGMLALYECTFDEEWLKISERLVQQAMTHYYDKETGLFWFTSDEDPPLITRKTEIADNVCPASCSTLAKVLERLYRHTDLLTYLTMATGMLQSVQQNIMAYGSAYSNWMSLQTKLLKGSTEVAIVGNSVHDFRLALQKASPTHLIFAGSIGQSDLPLLKNRYVEGKTLIYICRNGTCELPVTSPDAAIANLRSAT